jgi:predicted dinucleotide-binding enzyme
MIAIIGAGNVGKALGQRCRAIAEPLVYGVPEPAKYEAPGHELNAPVLGVEDAIRQASIVILAVPHAAAADVAALLADWEGRILVDVTNPLAPKLDGLTVGTTSSAAEQLAAAANGARVVKAFNTTGAENLANPRYPLAAAFLPVCGDDADARAAIVDLALRMGFDAVDLGPLRAARYTEPFAMMWIHMAYACGHGRHFAFARMQRTPEPGPEDS